jgi:hypothetical protein
VQLYSFSSSVVGLLGCRLVAAHKGEKAVAGLSR